MRRTHRDCAAGKRRQKGSICSKRGERDSARSQQTTEILKKGKTRGETLVTRGSRLNLLRLGENHQKVKKVWYLRRGLNFCPPDLKWKRGVTGKGICPETPTKLRRVGGISKRALLSESRDARGSRKGRGKRSQLNFMRRGVHEEGGEGGELYFRMLWGENWEKMQEIKRIRGGAGKQWRYPCFRDGGSKTDNQFQTRSELNLKREGKREEVQFA